MTSLPVCPKEEEEDEEEEEEEKDEKEGSVEKGKKLIRG
jgi:hypothetical protein